jgi:hypothetical protein
MRRLGFAEGDRWSGDRFDERDPSLTIGLPPRNNHERQTQMICDNEQSEP